MDLAVKAIPNLVGRRATPRFVHPFPSLNRVAASRRAGTSNSAWRRSHMDGTFHLPVVEEPKRMPKGVASFDAFIFSRRSLSPETLHARAR